MARASRVVITGRGFRQNAANAMRGDIVRGLIELITNADDAYGSTKGDIRVDVLPTAAQGFSCEVAVRDRAIGLTADEIEAKFFEIGAATSASAEGGESRGFFGRGAKDVTSFGSARFAAIKNDRYSEVLIDRDGDAEWIAEDRPITASDLEALGLSAGEAGLTATILVEKATIPKPDPLARQLGTHAQLRNLCLRREVIIRDLRGDQPAAATADGLRVDGEVLLDTPIELAEGFEPVHLRVVRLATQERGTVNEFSRHGLLVSDGTATHMNSLFGMEGRPGAGFIAGEVSCPEIRKILRASSDEDGGASLISLARDGLMPSHPYTKALSRAVHEQILPIIEAIAAEAGAASDSSTQLRKDMEDARRAMQDELKSILKDIDDESTGGTGDDVPPLQLIPQRVSVVPGRSRSITLRVRNDIEGNPTIAVEGASPLGCVWLNDSDDIAYVEHERLGVRSGIVRAATAELGTAKIVARIGDAIAECPVTVEHPDQPPEPTPEALEFRPAKASVAPTRNRHLRLVAPIDFSERFVEITSVGEPTHELPEVAELYEASDGSMLEGHVTLRAGSDKGDVVVNAAAGTASASCTVAIADPASGIGIEWDYTIQHGLGAIPRSSRYWSGETLMITVAGDAPSVKPILGNWDSDAQTYANAESAAARAMLAEIVSLELAAHLTEAAAERPKYAQRLREADRALQMQRDIQARLARFLHRALAPDPER